MKKKKTGLGGFFRCFPVYIRPSFSPIYPQNLGRPPYWASGAAWNCRKTPESQNGVREISVRSSRQQSMITTHQEYATLVLHFNVGLVCKNINRKRTGRVVAGLGPVLAQGRLHAGGSRPGQIHPSPAPAPGRRHGAGCSTPAAAGPAPALSGAGCSRLLPAAAVAALAPVY